MLYTFPKFGELLSIGDIAFRLFVVVFVGAVIGIDRETKNRPAGMRTHVLVGVGAALIAIIERQTIGCVLALNASSLINVSAGRITSTVVSGVGFLGAGTIVMSDRKISGLTTAASLWCMACIGLAAGYGFSVIALIAGLIVLVVLKLLQRIVHVQTLKKLEVHFVHRTETLAFLSECFTDIKKKKNKKSYAKLTLDNMKEHIEEMDGKDSPVMKEYETLMTRYKLHAGRYAKIKSWYLKQYADEYKDADENDEVETENE